MSESRFGECHAHYSHARVFGGELIPKGTLQISLLLPLTCPEWSQELIGLLLQL